MKKSLFTLAAAALLGSACIEELEGFLYFNWDAVPDDTVSTTEVQIAGQVVRTPPRQGLITLVTAQGGASTVVDTVSDFGLFDFNVPLVLNAENQITVAAEDNTGATTPNPRTFVVVHRDAMPLGAREPRER